MPNALAKANPTRERSHDVDLSRLITELLMERANFIDPVRGRLHPATLAKVSQAVQHNQRLELILPAFPAKSSNRQKTIAKLPDLGEYLALEYLHNLCQRIGKVYAPGAELILCSDGRVFSELVFVNDAEVNDYRDALEGIIDFEGLSSIKTFHLEDMLPNKTYAEMRDYVDEFYAEDLTSLKQRIRFDEDTKQVFNGIHRFMFEDALVHFPGKSRNAVRKLSKDIAVQVMRRSDAWSRLLQRRYPLAIRLSIHPHFSSANKLGIQLIPGDYRWATPWHNCVVHSKGQLRLCHQREALAAGAKLQLFKERYAYYEQV